jgi:hypothetical protein
MKSAYKGKTMKLVRPELRGEAARMEVRARLHGLKSGSLPKQYAEDPHALLGMVGVCLAQAEAVFLSPGKADDQGVVVLNTALDEAMMSLMLFRQAFMYHNEHADGAKLEVVSGGKVSTKTIIGNPNEVQEQEVQGGPDGPRLIHPGDVGSGDT